MLLQLFIPLSSLLADTTTMITPVDISRHLQCPICKNLLTDPVSTTCGHTFCKDCLDKHISRSDSQCPLCQEPVTTKPSVNKAIEALLQETHLPNLDLFCGERDAIPCDVCDEHLTFKAVKSCLICSLSFCNEHLKPHQSMARFRGHKLVSPVEKLDHRACNTHEKEQQEIQEVFAALMEALRKTEQVLLAPLEDGRKCLEKEMDEKTQQIQKDILKYKEAIESLNRTQNEEDDILFIQVKSGLCAVNVTLDAETAHPHLEVSEDGKEVRDTGARHDIPCGPQQFDLVGGVLGKPHITSGRAFWVVEVGNKVGWELGVMRDGAKRKGKVSYKPSEGYWAIMLCAQNMYGAFADPPVQLHLETRPQKLGVFVDCEEALVSFYDMEALSHIYSFTHCSFNGAIRPYFNPHPNRDGSNSSPLVICPLNQTDISV
uniref:Uncharacterized protein n=1 Tax=Cyprinus carpio carpio TaxID=630221 RepID=A0A8C1F7H2_CYPCA